MKNMIFDKSGRKLAVIDVREESPGHYRGTIIEPNFPEEMLSLFREYEQQVNAQLFSILDEIEKKIDDWELYFGQKRMRIKNLQVMGQNKISFQL